MEEKKDSIVPIGEKYLLTVKEAGAYFNIGVLSIFIGNRYLVIRLKFEEYICQTSTI